MNLSPEQFEMMASIMYSPIDYIHTDYITEKLKDDNIILQKIANHQLIKKYDLLTELDCNIDSVIEKILTHWSILPKCALFLGYFYSPKTLLLSENYYELDANLQAFLTLTPLVKIDEQNQEELQNRSALEIGYLLLANFISANSKALYQRFNLLFTQELSQIAPVDTLCLSRSLFLLVLNYAAISA